MIIYKCNNCGKTILKERYDEIYGLCFDCLEEYKEEIAVISKKYNEEAKKVRRKYKSNA